jgi:hypothetical protein
LGSAATVVAHRDSLPHTPSSNPLLHCCRNRHRCCATTRSVSHILS